MYQQKNSRLCSCKFTVLRRSSNSYTTTDRQLIQKLVVNWFAVNNLLRPRVRYTVIKADFCRQEYPYWRFFFCQTLSFLVQSFVRTGIPVCEVTFREHQDDVINLLKKVQISTRQLQHAACHSKVCCCNHLIANVFVGNWS